ncbi:relaxase/mobilization nuclease domain-containing protein [Streptomyces chromofuscus]|uniref:Relaxase/mobilization nuclease domain-containing protein n=1 Tax=Streptomyces chromofuscus TaxID=42881 RepID=A0A7M2T424_STRCW|nr:relaxase/mobilization nuclease domain-containing protein [Streptomyces chromofuscus]QOV43034.1 relaxase/mobilization nuclease domain-containing protein [Streptomyces chromofuscus]GGS93223.1 mobilization protein [Streptomyces chromofuscus]
MIPRIHKRGQRTLGLLYYLYGPGKYEEHTDPHLVASWDHNAPDPGRDESATLKQLQQLLDQPLENIDEAERPKKHVWHLSVRNAAEDRILSDEEWGDIARRMVAAAGIDDPDQGAGCRWAAVRHADDHIHIVATLVREDGYKPDLDHDAARVQAQARTLEVKLGLRRLNKGDGTAAQRPTSAERHKAERQGRERTAREELRETVRRAVAGATSEEEFFDRLAAAGLLIRKRAAPSGDLLGYKVALPDDRNAQDEPVFYPGARLAPDLSLPRIRERWSADSHAPNTAPSGAASARRRTASAAWQAVLVVEHGDDTVAAAYIAAAGEVLDALAKTSAAHTRRELREAAWAFERASRSHVRAERGHDRALRQAARDLVRSGPALGRGEDGATTAMAIDMLFFLITAAAHWHAKKNHAQQAAAARQAAEHLRAAYQAAAAQPLGALYQRGRRLNRPLRQRQTAVLREALPELAEQILAEPGWYALAATLADAESADHDPAVLLAEAAGRREMESAESVSDVLVWRLRRAAGLPADTTDVAPEGHGAERSTRRAQRPAQGRSGSRSRRQ